MGLVRILPVRPEASWSLGSDASKPVSRRAVPGGGEAGGRADRKKKRGKSWICLVYLDPRMQIEEGKDQCGG